MGDAGHGAGVVETGRGMESLGSCLWAAENDRDDSGVFTLRLRRQQTQSIAA